MQVDKKDPIVAHVTIPIISTGPVRLLVDKCLSATLSTSNDVIETTEPGELVTTSFFSRYRLPFYEDEPFKPAPGTKVMVFYDENEYPPGKFPSVTIMGG